MDRRFSTTYSHSGRRKGNAPCDTSSVAFLQEISVWSIFSGYGLVRAGGRLINFIHLKQEISLMSPKLVFDPCPDAGRLIYAPHVTSWSRFSYFLSPLHRLCGICAFTRQFVGRGDCEVSLILFFAFFSTLRSWLLKQTCDSNEIQRRSRRTIWIHLRRSIHSSNYQIC